MSTIEVRRYITDLGKDVVGEWMDNLKDLRARARILARIARLAVGNFGDCNPLRAGVLELRIDYGPGYRIYFARLSQSVVLLLCGGDKRRQDLDIERAVKFWKDYEKRTQ